MKLLRYQLVSIICLLTFMVSALTVPMKASAQAPDVVAFLTAEKAYDTIGDVLKNAALIGVKNAMSAFLGKLAYDAAVYVSSAGTGQASLVYPQSVGDYMRDAGDAAVGGAIEGVATAAGLDAAGLCDPGDSFRIDLTIGLETNLGGPSVYKPACTLTELAGNWREAYSDPDFSKFVQLQFDSTANPLGISLEVENLTIVAKEEARQAAEDERLANNSGFADKVDQISGTILTPGDQIKRQFEEPQGFAQQFAVQSIGNPAVDALSIFSSTLVSKLMQRVQQGLANFASGDQLSGLLGGSFSGTTSGRAAAEARYASLRQPVFATSGSFDVLSEMAACPNDSALRTVNNCTIGSAFQTAIQEGWTVQEFVDYQSNNGQSFKFSNDNSDTQVSVDEINNSSGINGTGIAVLKKFRVIPVGWQVAYDYINSSIDQPTLKQLTDCYNFCGTADENRSCDYLLSDASGNQTDYSPYCGLVDPYWVLKAPQNFCEREAPGDTIAQAESFPDAVNPHTQEELTVTRLNYCADARGCIQEDESGVCSAYGYCTEEERIYRFEGEICDEEYSSCETFTDTDDNDASYVKSSLNYNDCATDPGCQWYCLSTDDAGNFNCASPTSTYISCSEEVTTHETDYDSLAGIGLSYNGNEACACTTKQTCPVPAGSTSGDSDGNGLTDYRQCLVSNTDGSQSVCTLNDNCGASNPNYDESTSTCTCEVSNTASVSAGDSSVDITVEKQDHTDAVQRCNLDDEDDSDGPDTCSSTYSTYSNAPVCEVTTGTMNCGDVCYSEAGGTCTNSLGNTCTDGSTTDADATADGDCLLVDSCSIATGSYSCTSSDGNICILGTVDEDPKAISDTIYFDDNVETCNSSDADCTQYIRIKPDTNLIPNALFDYIDANNDTVGDPAGDGLSTTDSDSLAFCSHDGSGCSTDDNCVEDLSDPLDGDGTDPGETEGQCIGWIQHGVTAYVLDSTFDSLVTPDVGTNYIQLAAATASDTLETTIDTGHALENRTFTFAYRAMTLGTCSGTDVSFTIGSSDGADVSSPITADADSVDYAYSSDWQDFTATYTFADGVADTKVTVAIKASTSCSIDIGATSLVEDNEFSGDYTNYAINNVTYLNGDTVSCEPEDVGCELYVQAGQDDSEGIPGTITNADSDACRGTCSDGINNTDETSCLAASAANIWDATAYNFSDPSCSQCNGDPALDQADDYYASCDFYQEVALEHTAPITTIETWLTPEQRAGAMERSGKYCAGDSTLHCFDGDDCPSGVACLQELSIVPTSGQSCSAAAVGCEEYTNLATVEAGGEGLEYYTALQQCVRTDDTDTAVFYTFEGSDSSGVAVVDHTLKLAADGSPCTNLDLSSEDYNADCTDSPTTPAVDCGPDGDDVYGTDADCRQFAQADGTIFYRYESDVIVASDDCTALRNTQDSRVYFALPSESNSCSADEVSCREYKGTDSGSEQTIIDEDFSANDTTNWLGAASTSNESVLQTGYSLQLQDPTTTNISYALFTTEDSDGDGTSETFGALQDGYSYVLSFWAESTEGGTLIASLGLNGKTSNDYYFTADGVTTTAASTSLPNDGDWHKYTLGPVILPEGTDVDGGDEYFNLNFSGTTATSEAYIDTILLTESNSQYLIQDTATACNNFEGCREYQDRNGDTYYLKSFLRLCGDDVVGCEAMIATQNSANPFTEAYNLDNEYDQDDVIVQYDQPVTVVYDEDNLCSSTVMGCMEVGLPSVDNRTGEITDYQSTYLLNLPDDYNTTLCEQPQLSCEEYTSTYDGTVYFKDPGEKLCELKEYTTDGNTFKGWFKVDSTATDPDCPVQYDYSSEDVHYASQPLGGVCNSNSIKVSEGACADSSGNNTQLIIKESDCVAAGYTWYSSFVDNRVGDLCNADTDCYPTGWASTDPRPRCISSLDDDVDVNDGGVHQYLRTEDDGINLAAYLTDFGWTGLCPDEEAGCSEYVDPYSPNITEINKNWSFEDDARDDSNVYYADDAVPTGLPDYWKIPYNTTLSGGSYTEIDLDADGTVDISSTCDTTDALISTYTGSSVNPADGASVLALTGPCALEQSSSYLDLRPDATYTIQGQVKMPKYQMDNPATTTTPSEFSIGVHFYTSDNDGDGALDQLVVDDQTLYPVADHATLAFEDGSDPVDSLSYWYRFQGSIGLGTTLPIPADALYAKVFVVNHSAGTVYFDAVSFKEVDKYYYLDYTVDGTPEREQQDGTNTCVNQDTEEGEITSDGGCVAFRDMTSDTQNYSQDGLDCTTCLLTPNSDACRYIADACDTNTVLKVKRDRVCSEWLSCETALLVEDDQGNVSSQCYNILGCTALDENGYCSEKIYAPGYDELSSSSDLHYSTADGDANALTAIRNLTGYVKIGMTWNDIPYYCEGGASDGAHCSVDSDCQADGDTTATCSVPLSTEGYYPYGSMMQVGESGSQTGDDLIELNDFENLYCAGTKGDPTVACIANATDDTGSIDAAGNCYTSDLEQTVDAGTATFADSVYVGATGSGFRDDANNANLAFCPNSPDFDQYWDYGGNGGGYNYTEDGWRPLPDDATTASNIFITQFQQYQNCEMPCQSVDLNNVLQIDPTGTDGSSSGGASYDLQDNINETGTYSLSFDGRYVNNDYVAAGGSGIPSSVQICLRHYNIGDSEGNELDRRDCFVNGLGMADIVFAIDTSGTMAIPITAVKDAVPALAEQLAAAGIDARFALVDMDDDNDDAIDTTTTGVDDDGDGCVEDGSIAGNYVDLDFTSSVDDFRDAVDDMQALGSPVDNYDAIYDVANNSFIGGSFGTPCPHPYSLTYRSGAQKFLIQVTDIDEDELDADSGADNEIGPSEAEDAAVAAHLKVFIVSDNDSYAAYQSLTEDTGGAAYNFTDASAATTYRDWAADTSIVEDLVTGIAEGLDVFQFTTDMQTYALGPISITEKDIGDDETVLNDGVQTKLEFLGSAGASFQIDNVSLSPVLEVSKDQDPIARSCRAYPQSDSLQCSYSENNGTSFLGWKGYCLEPDPLNPVHCITWWPVDLLIGETSIVSREPSGYSGPSDVYHCLISKGLEHPGFCDEQVYGTSSTYTNGYGEGVLCTDDSTCNLAGSHCFQGANYTLQDTTSGGINEHDIASLTPYTSAYTESTTTDGGQCQIQDEGTSCSTWPSTGVCSDPAYETEADCTDTSVGGTWSTVVDILQTSAVFSSGDCINVGGHYAEEYHDPTVSTGSYCFYDVDGEEGNEVRSTRPCTEATEADDCRTAPASTEVYQCANLTCAGGTNTLSCGYVDDEASSRCADSPAAYIDTSYETRPLRWQMPDPAEDHIDLIDPIDNEYERGVIVRLPANEILRNIQASEMEVIEFNPGSAGDGAGSGNEYPYWGQLNGGSSSGQLGTIYDTGTGLGDRGNIWLTDLITGAIQYADGTSGDIVDTDNCYSYSGDARGFGCRMWGLYDSDFELNKYTSLSLPQFSAGYHGLDLVYSWVWSNFDYDTTVSADDATNCDLSGGDPETDSDHIFDLLKNQDINAWSDSGCVEEAFGRMAGSRPLSGYYRNIWHDIEDSNPGLWSQFYDDDGSENTTKIVPFSEADISDADLGGIWPDSSDSRSAFYGFGGGNIMSLYIDFNDEGYIQDVYAMVYFAAVNTQDTPVTLNDAYVETTLENMMHLDIQTRESCELVGESVGNTGQNHAWADRASDDTGGYLINHDSTADAYGIDEPSNPFGAISPQTGTPIEWDTVVAEAEQEPRWNAYEAQPAIAEETDDIDSGHPLSCIGECDTMSCVGNPDTLGDECTSSSSCGSGGICMGIGDSTISNDGQIPGSAHFQSQIDDVVKIAADRLKHVFANINSFYQLDFSAYATNQNEIYTSISDVTSGYWDAPGTHSNMFDTMRACNDNGGARPDTLGDDQEYCGVYPTLTAITLNDESSSTDGFYPISNGQTVTMTFTSNVDIEQKPLADIYIDWDDDTEPTPTPWDAEPTTHIFTHAYNCSPDNVNAYVETEDGAYCLFTPKIVVTDNWGWCSGQQAGFCDYSEDLCATHDGTWADTVDTYSYCDGYISGNDGESDCDSAESSVDAGLGNNDGAGNWITVDASPHCTNISYTEEDCLEQAGDWSTFGDHRYAEDDTDGNNIMSSCQSYDEPNLTLKVDAT